MDIEDRLGRMLDADAARTAVPVHTIIAEATRRGRKLRRRRRIARCLGAVLAVGLIAGGAAAVRLDPFGRPPAVAPAGNGVSDPATGPTADGTVEASPAGLLGVLFNINTATGYGNFTPITNEDRSLVGFQVDQESGPGSRSTVTVQLTRDTRAGTPGRCPASPYFPTPVPENCTQLGNGTRVFAEEQRMDENGVYRRVVAQHPDGLAVEITVFNGVLQDTVRGSVLNATRADPPLTAAALTAIAASTVWDTRIPAATAASGVELARGAG
ncbi:hypothetical protein KNE206_73160 [Kitasatospora sp. NE20-6]|uniref:hypothetical protein n=1 Tax=Kitasatospora sp. NE20-6 TaxID=2859066 RepID=UPI0034DC7553